MITNSQQTKPLNHGSTENHGSMPSLDEKDKIADNLYSRAKPVSNYKNWQLEKDYITSFMCRLEQLDIRRSQVVMITLLLNKEIIN